MSEQSEEHRQFGAGCTACDWVSIDPRKSLREDHAEHAQAARAALRRTTDAEEGA